MWITCPRLLRSIASSRIWTHDLPIASTTPYSLHYHATLLWCVITAVVYCCSWFVWAGFQLGDKPLGALEPCSSVEEEDNHVAVTQQLTPTCRSIKIKSKLTKTPCILRRRRKKKKSVVHHPKSSASTSSASPSVFVSSNCTRVSNTSTDSCATPQKEQSEQILPFSPSQVRFFCFIFCCNKELSVVPFVENSICHKIKT